MIGCLSTNNQDTGKVTIRICVAQKATKLGLFFNARILVIHTPIPPFIQVRMCHIASHQGSQWLFRRAQVEFSRDLCCAGRVV